MRGRAEHAGRRRRSGRGSRPPSPTSSRRWSPSRPTRRPRPTPPAAATRPGCGTRPRPARWPPAAATSPSGRPGSRSGPRWSPTAWPTSSAGWPRASARRPTRPTGSSAPSAPRSPSSASTRWWPAIARVIDVRLTELQDERRRQTDEARAASLALEHLRRDRAEAERRLAEIAERQRRAEIEEAEARTRLEAAVEHVRRELDTEPGTAVAAPAPPLAEGVTPAGAGAGPRARAPPDGPDQPSGPRGVHRAAGAPPLPGGAAGGRPQHPAGPAAGDPGSVDAEIQSVFAAAFADVSEHLHRAVRDAVPRRHRPADPHRPRRPAVHRHRGRGQAVGQEREEAVAAVGRRALPDRAWPSCSPCSAAGRRRST